MKNYYLRTDVIPEEAPILFSNRQLYESKTFSEKAIRKSLKAASDINNLKVGSSDVNEKSISNTVPMIMPVVVRSDKKRAIAILHPFAQIQTFRFIIQFEEQLLLHFKKSSFSVRSPRKRNDNKLYIDQATKNETYNILNRYRSTDNKSLSEANIKKFRHYFSYKNVSNLNDMFSQKDFVNSRKKYKHLIKFDVLNFFPSIYTHSISWALYSSKKIGKLNKNFIDSFQNQADKVTQSINFSETNGIVVGPEYSRIIAEIVLTSVDRNVESDMYLSKYEHGKDYQVFRYVDDIYVFFNRTDVKDKLQTYLDEELEKYNLKINTTKIAEYDAGLAIAEKDTNEVKEAFSLFENNNRLIVLNKNFELLHKKNASLGKKFELADTRGTYNQLQMLFSRIKDIIYSNLENKTKIINYVFACIMYRINLSLNFKNERGFHSYIRALNFFLDQLVILLKLSPTRKTYGYYVRIQLTLLRDIKKSLHESFLVNKQNDLEKIYDNIFSSIRDVLSFGWFDPVQGYDLYPLIAYFKKYDMYLTPFHLINTLINYDNYVVYTAIAYYIYDGKGVSPNFKTVEKKLYQEVKQELKFFKNKGMKEKSLTKDAEFFYMVNDFSKYPGFSGKERQSLGNILKQEAKDVSLIKEISKKSYYEWNADFDDYAKRAFMKIIIGKVNKVSNYYD